MKRIVTTAAFAAALAVTACGSDSDSGPELSDSQEAAAESAVESAAEDGVTLDRSCVNDVAAQLSEADAALAAQSGDAELSPEGEALTLGLLQCASDEDLVEFFISNLRDSGGTFDEDCLREELGAIDLQALIVSSAQDEDPPAEFVTAVESCVAG